MELIAWLIWTVIETRWNWHLIYKKKRYIRHGIMFIPRVVVGILMLFLMIKGGYMWYWAGSFIVFTHALIFPELLNKWRGKRWGYLGDPNPEAPNKSWYDKVIQGISHVEMPWLSIRIILFLSAVGIAIVYGTVPFGEIGRP